MDTSISVFPLISFKGAAMSGTKVLISQLAISMGQSIGLSLLQQESSISSQQGIMQFSTENSGVTAIKLTKKMEIVDMIVLRIS